jgi:hypothetical protein
VAKFVPRLLPNKQKQHRLEICRELQQQLQGNPKFLSEVITDGEICVYGYDPETKQQSSQWKSPSSPRPKIFDKSRATLSPCSSPFYNIDGIVHREFVPPGQTVNKVFCCDVVRSLREDMRRSPEKWRTNDWVLHHDNSQPHTVTLCRNVWLNEDGGCSPPTVLARLRFFLFSNMMLMFIQKKKKNKLRGP